MTQLRCNDNLAEVPTLPKDASAIRHYVRVARRQQKRVRQFRKLTPILKALV